MLQWQALRQRDKQVSPPHQRSCLLMWGRKKIYKTCHLAGWPPVQSSWSRDTCGGLDTTPAVHQAQDSTCCRTRMNWGKGTSAFMFHGEVTRTFWNCILGHFTLFFFFLRNCWVIYQELRPWEFGGHPNSSRSFYEWKRRAQRDEEGGKIFLTP